MAEKTKTLKQETTMWQKKSVVIKCEENIYALIY